MRFVTIFITGFLLSSCASMSNYNPRTMVSGTDVRSYEAVDSKDFKFENKDLVIQYKPDIADASTMVNFTNKTNKIIKIVWDETVYISPLGQSDRVFHDGVKIIDRDRSQVPSIIMPKSSQIDMVTANSNVHFETGQYGGWKYTPICGSVSLVMHELEDKVCIGKVFGYMFTYEIEGKKKTATIKFKYLSKAPIEKKSKQL